MNESNNVADGAIVSEYMSKLEHPLKNEMEAVRLLIKNTNSKIVEKIKWNAPSYSYREDFLTFNPRETKSIHLIFHHHSIEAIVSPLFEGNFKGRRMVYLKNFVEIETHRKELERIINKTIDIIDKKTP